MTAPINFPGLRAPELATPSPGPLNGFAELMTAIQQHRDAVAEAQQRLALEQQRTESEVSAQGAQTAATKQATAQKAAEFDRQQKVLQAHDIVAGELSNVATQPGDFMQNVEAARVKLIQQNKQIAPFINDAVNQQRDAAIKTLTDAAQQKRAQSEANVATATEGGEIAGKNANNAVAAATQESRITTSKEQAARAVSEAETAKIQLGLAKLAQTYGTDRAQLATQVLDGGGTLEQAYRISGVPVPPGVDPNWTKQKGTQSAMLGRQLDYVDLMANAVPEVEKLYKKANPAAVSALIKFPLAGNVVATPATRQYVMHAADFLAGVLHEESGSRLNDAQIAWGVRRYVIIGGDDAQTKEAKMANMRAVLKARQKNPNYIPPGAPISDAARGTFSGASGPNPAGLTPADATNDPAVAARFKAP